MPSQSPDPRLMFYCYLTSSISPPEKEAEGRTPSLPNQTTTQKCTFVQYIELETAHGDL